MKTEQKPSQTTIALRYGMVVVPEKRADAHAGALSVQAELMNLGFVMDERLYSQMVLAPREWVASFYNEAVPFLKTKLGAGRHFTPFYKNFPTQVMEMSHHELFLNALLHYWSDGTWEPDVELKDRGIHFENTDFKVLKAATEEEFCKIFTRALQIQSSLPADDKEMVEWFLENRKEVPLPSSIPFKETLCLVAGAGRDVPVKTPTDVLRIAVYMSGGDISLPGVPKVTTKETTGRWAWHARALRETEILHRETFKFKKFSRPQRRHILGLLEKTHCAVEEMQGRLGRWLRLGEVLHVCEYAKKFPKAALAFAALRNQKAGEKIRTFNATVNMSFEKNWKNGVFLLSERPGEFARKLDWMVRTYDATYVLDTFRKIGSDVSSKVLFELYQHFEERLKPNPNRFIIIKGERSVMKQLEPLPPLPHDMVVKIRDVILSIIKAKIASLPKMGHVWIDERLKKVPVPFSMRSINSSIKTYVRGTRIPFRADAKVVRAFVHWFDKDGTEDLDLSASFHGETLALMGHVSYTCLKEFNCAHSGDIRHRRGACAEYIDVGIQDCLDRGVRYVAVQVHNFENRAMYTIPNTVFGVMEREKAVANKIFIPKTISNCAGLANESPTVIACLLDLKEREYIWADLESQSWLATVETSRNKTMEVLRALVAPPKLSVYTLLSWHAEARGQLVPSLVEATNKFSWDDFVSDYSKVAEFMVI